MLCITSRRQIEGTYSTNEIGSFARMFKIGRDNVTNATRSLGLHLNDFGITIKAD